MLVKRTISLLIAILPLLWACKDKDVSPAGTLTARAGEDRETLVGEKTELDGSASTDSDGKTFTYRWQFTAVPQGSSAALSLAETSKPHFTPDRAGVFELTLTIENENGKSQDKVIVNAAVAQPIELTSPISIPTVLVDRIANPDFPDYVVTGDLSLTSQLTIEPGVVIAFHRDRRLEVQENGRLVAQGEAERRVVFTGLEKTKGFWSGVLFRSASSANKLDYLILEYAGSRVLSFNQKAGLFMTGANRSTISISNTRFLHNDGYGIYLQEGAEFSSFSRNHFEGNTLAGLLVDATTVGSLDHQSTFTGNGRNVVEITASTLGISPAGMPVWKKFTDGTPYRIQGQLNISGPVKWEAGTTFELVENGGININANGWLEAKGTAESKIRVRGVESRSGYWKGILCYSDHTSNVLEHVELSGGGSVPIVSNTRATLAVYGSQATMTVRNSKISNSGGHGAFVNYQASINADFETANQFENNQLSNLLKE